MLGLVVMVTMHCTVTGRPQHNTSAAAAHGIMLGVVGRVIIQKLQHKTCVLHIMLASILSLAIPLCIQRVKNR